MPWTRPAASRSRAMSPQAHVTIVTTCKGRLAYLRDSLPTWLHQHYDNFDVVVVDFDCPDGTRHYVESIRSAPGGRGRALDVRAVHVPDRPRFNLNEARNIGIRSTSADLVLVIDADTHIRTKTLLRDINRKFRDGVVFFSNLQVLTPAFFEAACYFKAHFGVELSRPALVPVGGLVPGLSGTACFSRPLAEACGLYKPAINDIGFGYDEWDFYIRLLNHHFYHHQYDPAGGPMTEQLGRALSAASTWEADAFTNIDNPEDEKHRFYPHRVSESRVRNKEFVRAILRNPETGLRLDGHALAMDAEPPWSTPLPPGAVGRQTVSDRPTATAGWFGFWFNSWYGSYLSDRGEAPEARRYLQQALAHPHRLQRLLRSGSAGAVARYHLASAYQKLGDFPRARRQFTQLLDAGMFTAGALFHLGEMAFLGGRDRQARSYLRQCLDVVPDHGKAARYLSQIEARGHATGTASHAA